MARKKGTEQVMAAASTEQRYTPYIILALVAALVLVIALWATGRAGESKGVTAGPALEVGQYQWKLVTTWPKNFPGLGAGPENFARYVDEMSAGRLKIHVYGAGEIVPPFEIFDAVSQGVADAGHGAAYYWKGKVPSSVFFTAIPFGMNAQEMNGCFGEFKLQRPLSGCEVEKWAVVSRPRRDVRYSMPMKAAIWCQAATRKLVLSAQYAIQNTGFRTL